MKEYFPVGKLPADFLNDYLARAPLRDPRVLMGPGIGRDCAVVQLGETCLVFKSDPITFAADEIGWYAVQVNANDIATSGARPRWMLATLLLPEGLTTIKMVDTIFEQIYQACEQIEVDVIGGHTEITYDLKRPVLVGTMIGETSRDNLVRPDGLQGGDRILLTKGVPVEATAIIARELPERLSAVLSLSQISQACDYLYHPGISVLPEAQIAIQAGRVHGMHDPTEGGLYGALWELAQASGKRLVIDPLAVPVPELAEVICQAVGIDPLGAIASGALLLAVAPDEAGTVLKAIESEGILCVDIGEVQAGRVGVWHATEKHALPRPDQDEIARLFGE